MELVQHIALMALLLTGSVEQSVVIENNNHSSKQTAKDGRVGIRVSYKTGQIEHVYDRSPAKEAGVLRGDYVLLVDGMEQNCHAIHGLPGTRVHLKIRRKQDVYEVDLTRIDRKLITAM